tara:strand:+ start:1907 stop:2794 length:888 start_codon:yes stop_codon:yes gene_type:complete
MLFKSYPTITRLIESRLTEVQDILRKVVFTDESIERDRQFVTYKKRDGDTLESIARRFYGRDDLSWVIMLFNKVIDPLYGVSLSTAAFDQFTRKKYDGQTLFLSAVGSSFPLSLDSAGITVGSFCITKITNDDNSVSYREDPRGTVKNFDPTLGSVQITEQTGKFSKDQTFAIFQDRVEVVTATITKAVDSSVAPNYFAEKLEGSSSDPLNPLASIPNSHGVQTSIGNTSADFATAVTYGNTLLFDYIFNDTGTYIIDNKMKEFKDNYDKSQLLILDPKIVPALELEMRKLFRNA